MIPNVAESKTNNDIKTYQSLSEIVFTNEKQKFSVVFKYYDRAKKYMPNGTCGVITFGIKGGRDASIKFMDSLKLIAIVTHVADARSCVLHPASHTHRQMSDEQLLAAGVQPDLIRFSVGIEDIEDILADVDQALEKV